MKFGVIIPDRGDRPELLKHCLWQLSRQTVLPAELELVNYEPESKECDITQRYKRGYDKLRNKNLDCIFFIENDDWYAPEYFETQLLQWNRSGRPVIFGTTYNIFYNLKLKAYYKHTHIQRSMSMSSLITPDLEIDFGHDNNPYTDSWLYDKLKRNYKLWEPQKLICMGIKHWFGKSGGHGHTTELQRFKPPRGTSDKDLDFLRATVDKESFEFYTSLFALA